LGFLGNFRIIFIIIILKEQNRCKNASELHKIKKFTMRVSHDLTPKNTNWRLNAKNGVVWDAFGRAHVPRESLPPPPRSGWQHSILSTARLSVAAYPLLADLKKCVMETIENFDGFFLMVGKSPEFSDTFGGRVLSWLTGCLLRGMLLVEKVFL